VITRAVPLDGHLLGYHFPGVAGIGFSLDLLQRLKDSFPVQFAGLKDSSHDEDMARALGVKFGTDLAVFNGTDSYLSWALMNRASGCITAPANLISPVLREIYDAFAAGKDTSAAQSRATRQRELLERYAPFPASLKALLHRLHNLPRWRVRPPLVDMQAADEDEALTKLRALEGAAS
jgi:dihydrodipicolinate synthase/N-acetylneuraminate lyase